MAVSKAKSLPVSRQPKFAIYQSLYHLNLGCEMIAHAIQTLHAHKALSPETLQLHNAAMEELRSAMNHHLLKVLSMREERDWAAYGKEVRRLQPEDVQPEEE
jgi:hypothetical protein